MLKMERSRRRNAYILKRGTMAFFRKNVFPLVGIPSASSMCYRPEFGKSQVGAGWGAVKPIPRIDLGCKIEGSWEGTFQPLLDAVAQRTSTGGFLHVLHAFRKFMTDLMTSLHGYCDADLVGAP